MDLLSAQVGEMLKSRGLVLATAESCTGGGVAEAVTDIPGSSEWFERGFITYANQSKIEMLGVSEETLRLHGAVSEAVVREMAEGALRHSHAHIALAVSGIAGPGGGTPEKPVGTVCLAWAVQGSPTQSIRIQAPGDREAVRRQAVMAALQGILDLLHD